MAKRATREMAPGLPDEVRLTPGELHTRFVKLKDATAYTEIEARCRGHVFATALKVLHCKNDAEDVTQATFADYIEKCATIKHPDAIVSWLCTVASRLARKIVKRRTQSANDAALESIPSKEKSPYDHAALADDCAVLKKEMNRLSPPVRQALEDISAHDLNWKMAAAKRKISTSSISTGMEKLRTWLRPRLGIEAITALFVTLWTDKETAAAALSSGRELSLPCLPGRSNLMAITKTAAAKLMTAAQLAMATMGRNKVNLVCGAVILPAICLAFMPEAEADELPKFSIARYESQAMHADASKLKCFKLHSLVFSLFNNTFSNGPGEGSFAAIGLTPAMDGDVGVDVFLLPFDADYIKSIEGDDFVSRFTRLNIRECNVRGEVFYVPPDEMTPVLEEVVRRTAKERLATLAGDLRWPSWLPSH